MSKPSLTSKKDLHQLREELVKTDKALLELIFKRFELVKNIFTIKKQTSTEYKDKKQEEKVWNTFWEYWESNNTYLTKADWPYFSKVLTVLLDQSFLQAFKFITRKK
ncbi:MAG: hypothetical protein HAW63_01605 [Bdellovibrionaceae bacterium]|nr:hypothetical protein [Pseudobdellovibrionaceae bacterium]